MLSDPNHLERGWETERVTDQLTTTTHSIRTSDRNAHCRTAYSPHVAHVHPTVTVGWWRVLAVRSVSARNCRLDAASAAAAAAAVGCDAGMMLTAHGCRLLSATPVAMSTSFSGSPSAIDLAHAVGSNQRHTAMTHIRELEIYGVITSRWNSSHNYACVCPPPFRVKTIKDEKN